MKNSKTMTQFPGLKALDIDHFTEKHLRDIADAYASRFSERLQTDLTLKVHVRQYKAAQKDKQHKYSVSVHLLHPGDTLSVDKSVEWDIKRAVQKAMENMENRIQHAYHGDQDRTQKPGVSPS